MERALPEVPVPADAALIEEFAAMSELDQKTLHKYRRHLIEFRAWLEARAGGKRLIEVEKPDVLRFLADLKAGQRYGNSADGRPLTQALSASARKGVISALRSFYLHCNELYGLRYDPTHGVKTPRVAYSRGLSLHREEIRAYLDAPGSERDRVQAYLEVYTAARAGSLRGLRWGDVDFEQELLHFNAKFRNDYTLPLHPQLKAALLRWLGWISEEAARNERIDEALADPRTAFVLLTRNGRQLSDSILSKQAKWRAARVGIRRHPSGACVGRENKSQVSAHVFRRSYAQLERSRGVPIEDIAAVLHHKDINTTLNHYAYTDTPKLRETVTSYRV